MIRRMPKGRTVRGKAWAGENEQCSGETLEKYGKRGQSSGHCWVWGNPTRVGNLIGTNGKWGRGKGRKKEDGGRQKSGDIQTGWSVERRLGCHLSEGMTHKCANPDGIWAECEGERCGKRGTDSGNEMAEGF